MALISCPECGREVSEAAVMCPSCGYGIKAHFDAIAQKEEAEKRAKIKAVNIKKRNKFLKISIPVALIVIGTVIGLIINHNILSSRTTFDNEESMIYFLTGPISWKEDDLNHSLVFYDYGDNKLYGERLSKSYASGDMVEMHPSRGYFMINSTKYIVTNSYYILEEASKSYSVQDYTYHESYANPPYEDPIKSFKIEKVSDNADMQTKIFEGVYKVTNIGARPYSYVSLIIVFDIANGTKKAMSAFNTVESADDKYILKPGESGTAKLTVFDIPDNIKTYSVYIKDYMCDIS